MNSERSNVDVGALAGSISRDIRERVSETVVRLFDDFIEDGRPLNQVQKVDAVRVVLDAFDGLEVAVADELIRELAHARRRDVGARPKPREAARPTSTLGGARGRRKAGRARWAGRPAFL